MGVEYEELLWANKLGGGAPGGEEGGSEAEPSILNPKPYTLNPQPSTLNLEP